MADENLRLYRGTYCVILGSGFPSHEKIYFPAKDLLDAQIVFEKNVLDEVKKDHTKDKCIKVNLGDLEEVTCEGFDIIIKPKLT